MANYIRKTASFNPESEREVHIWNWVISKTDNFKKQNFSSFIKEKLEFCMNNDNGIIAVKQENIIEEPLDKKGWSKLI